jgi:hypothetical protein
MTAFCPSSSLTCETRRLIRSGTAARLPVRPSVDHSAANVGIWGVQTGEQSGNCRVAVAFRSVGEVHRSVLVGNFEEQWEPDWALSLAKILGRRPVRGRGMELRARGGARGDP